MKFIILLAALLLPSIIHHPLSTIHAQTNVLRVESVESPAGKALLLPIVMENTSDIAGVQFDISVPYELATDADGKVIANLSKTRAANHQVTTRDMGSDWNYYTYVNDNYNYYRKYRVIVFSGDNSLILDNEGTLLTLQLTMSPELADGTDCNVYLSNVTLTDLNMANKLTRTSNGKITIKEIPRPDLEPYDVTFTQGETGPGATLDVAWKVKNIGKAATEEGSGWSEEIALVNAAGTVSRVLTTTHFDGQIAAESEVSRSVQIALPQLLGIDGITQVQVTVIPNANAGEHQTLRDNNTAKSVNNLLVTKKLTLEISPESVSEGSYWQRITLKLTRSGSHNLAQSFKVTCTNSKGEAYSDSRIPIPEIINILEKESAAILYLDITDNNVLDAERIINLKVEPISETSTYAPVTGRIVIEDDELPTLTLTASKTELTEGTDKNFKLTVETNRAPEEDLQVTLTTENTRRFATFPATITIPAGETTAQMTVTVVDDDLANGTQSNKFTASAARHNKGEAIVVINDDDLPVLEMHITPTQVQESDGPVSVSGTLKRLSNKDKKVTVKLTDDANGGLYFGNRTLELAKGVEEVNFNFGPVDNQEVDGDRTYTVTAAVWLSSCSCSAVGEAAGNVTAQLTVLDDDGKALRLTAANGTVKEGGSTTLTVSRNTVDNSEPLTVSISSDYDEQLEYDHTVTIPAGEKSVNVEVMSKSNDVADDSHTVIFTVEASSSDIYAKGTCWLMVTDQTLPDAIVKSIAVSPEEILVGDPVQVTLQIANEGNSSALPAETTVKIYERGLNEPLASFLMDTPLPVGELRTIEKTVMLPKSVGKHQLYAVVNQENTVKELSTTNNTSANVSVEAGSPFGATLLTDKAQYNLNEVVVFNGQLSGRDIADAEVDLYVICDGVREVKTVRADGQGKFEYRWLLNGAMMGHAACGVCYPGAGAKTELAAFNIYGLRRTNTGYITFKPTVGVPVETSVELENPGVLPLTGVQVEVVSKPDSYDLEVNLPQTIEGNSKPMLTYTFTANAPATGSDWDKIILNVTSNEGVSLPITIHTFARMAEANLVCPNQRITTTMIKGQTREYPVTLINNGQGNTGKLSLALPDWISCAQGSTLAGINKGDTVTLVLLFKPTDDMQLNVPVTGTIGFNVEYGKGTMANFSVTPVSDQTGTLVVEVADEYTYYTDEKPRVKEAEVVLRNSVTNALITQGKTGEDGLCTFEDLPEGYYKLSVTADNHDSYSNNILVDPGTTTYKTVNLSVEAIKVTWTVEETEIEDVYDIVTTVTYETNVPAPVVDIVVPQRLPLDSLAEGQSLMFYAIATNKGLIKAENCEFTLPSRTGIYVWEPMGEYTGLTIAPQQSYILPVKVTRQTPAAGGRHYAGSESGCTTVTGIYYEWVCGLDHKWHKVEKPISYSVCPGKPGGGGGSGGGGGGGGGLGGPGGGGGGGYSASSSTTQVTSEKDCNPCLDALGRWIVTCVQNFIPIWGCTKGVYDCATSDEGALSRSVDCVLTTVSCSAEICAAAATGTIVGLPAGVVCEVVGKVASGLSCYKSFWKASERCWDSFFHDHSSSRRRADEVVIPTSFESPYSYVNQLAAAVKVSEQELQAYYDYLTEVMGNNLWIDNTTMSEIENLLAVVSTYRDEQITMENLRPYKPTGVTDEMLATFVERINNTHLYDAFGTESENRIHREPLVDAVERMKDAEAQAVAAGYTGVEEFWNDAFGVAYQKLNEQKGSVCSTITLQIKQTMVMTRQAFRGTLTVFNGHETESMKDMKLNLVVSDQFNNVATSHEFQINAESLKGLDGPLTLDGGWQLAPNSEGSVTVLFIPTKYAAPMTAQEYSFGGTLSYTDPYSGLEVSRELYPVTLTVKPSPELDLTYFMQRDIYGDDPLTLDVEEPMEDAEFALLINNKGYGDATNVRMTTMQPEIVENEKGLFIDFQIVSSQVNGGPAALSFGQTIANDLGDIPAHKQAYAQWWLQSTLLGHFTTYKVEATHVTSYGNEDLSLLDQVTIHELIHGFTPPAAEGQTAPARAFLVNDVEDAFDQPDQVYFTDATQQEVTGSQSISATKQSGSVYLLTVLPKQAGWTYGNLLDPTAGRQKLLKVVRQSDNLELPADNVWQTSRSLRDGQEWLYEHRLHIVGYMPAAGETYILTYEERPDVELEVEITEPVYEAEFAQQHLVTSDYDVVPVSFSKPIDASSFTADDVTLTVQGERQDLSSMTIVDKNAGNDKTDFELDLTTLNASLPNGYYVLSVQTAGITDSEGYQGMAGKKIDWVLFRGGLVQLNTTAYPVNSGTVSYVVVSDEASPARSLAPAANGELTYGAKCRLTAAPEEGYEFVNWTIGGEVVATTPIYDMTLNADLDIVANFKKKQFRLEMSTDGNGSLRGSGTGLYDYNTVVEIEAVPSEDFILKGWEVDGVAVGSAENPYKLTVNKATDVKALFVRDVYTQTLTMARGWNWMSTYLSESQTLGDVAQYADRIVSQENELIKDPVYGLVGGIDALLPGKAYKIEASTRFSRTMRGHIYNTVTAPLILHKGWNWMAYPNSEQAELATAITNPEEGDYIASQTGFAEYGDGSWAGTLDMLTPGAGYLYKSATDKSLAFDFSSAADGSRAWKSRTATVTEQDVDIHRYPNTMNMTVQIVRDGMAATASGYNIYAMADDELRGISEVVGRNHYLTVYGDKPVEVTFVVELAETGDTFVAAETLKFTDDVVGSRKSPFTLHIGSATGIDSFGADSRPMTVYTLQGVLVSREATLKMLRRLPKGVYIVNGQKCYIK